MSIQAASLAEFNPIRYRNLRITPAK